MLAGLGGFAGGVGDGAVGGTVGLGEGAGEGEGGGELGGGEEVVEGLVFQGHIVVGCRGRWGLGWRGGSSFGGDFRRGGGSGRRGAAAVEGFDKGGGDAADGVAVGFGSFLVEDFLTAYICQAARSRLLFGIGILVAWVLLLFRGRRCCCIGRA